MYFKLHFHSYEANKRRRKTTWASYIPMILIVCKDHTFINKIVVVFHREVQYYLTLKLVSPLIKNKQTYLFATKQIKPY